MTLVLALILAGQIVALVELLPEYGGLSGMSHELVEILTDIRVFVPARQTLPEEERQAALHLWIRLARMA